MWNYPESLDALKGLRQSAGKKEESPKTSSPSEDTTNEKAQSVPSDPQSQPPRDCSDLEENLLEVSSKNSDDVEPRRDVVDHEVTKTILDCGKVPENGDSKSAIGFWPIGQGDLYAAVSGSSAGLELGSVSGNFGDGMATNSGEEGGQKLCRSDSITCTCREQESVYSASTNVPNRECELELLKDGAPVFSSQNVHENTKNASSVYSTTDHDSAIESPPNKKDVTNREEASTDASREKKKKESSKKKLGKTLSLFN